ncbi:hypothetical protein ACFSTC_08745 [Nonomuraea ferruginea]
MRQKPVATPGAAGEQGGRWARLLASAPRWLPVLLVLEGLVMYVLAVKAPPGPYWGVDPEEINGLGLISALPVTAFAAILIMVVSFFVTVAQSTDRKFLLLFQIAAITFALHGVGALVAEEPRFPTAYIHAGFVEFIGRTGETAINIDARMGWPGFFALFAFVTKAAGIEDLTPILNWSPLLSNLLYLLPFVLILRQVVATTRARWFAALLFILVQWIGQDYFSPQGFTFALYLVFVAILLRWFGRVEPRTKPIPPKGLRRLLARLDAMTPGELANTGMFRADKLLMLMLLLALFVAATASHQITPFMMLGVLTAFLLFKRTSLTWGAAVLPRPGGADLDQLHGRRLLGRPDRHDLRRARPSARQPADQHGRPDRGHRRAARPGAAGAAGHPGGDPGAGGGGPVQAAAPGRVRPGGAHPALRAGAGAGDAELRRRDGAAHLHVRAARRVPAGRVRVLPQHAQPTAPTCARRPSRCASGTCASTPT